MGSKELYKMRDFIGRRSGNKGVILGKKAIWLFITRSLSFRVQLRSISLTSADQAIPD